MVEGELTVDRAFRLEQTQCIILGDLTSANDRGFACSFDDVPFLVAIPNADIPISLSAKVRPRLYEPATFRVPSRADIASYLTAAAVAQIARCRAISKH